MHLAPVPQTIYGAKLRILGEELAPLGQWFTAWAVQRNSVNVVVPKGS